MANLLGQNIGTNYRGILNLDSTINTPLDTTLRAVTDGMGTASPLQLSTTQVGFEQSSAGYINRWYNSGGTANTRKYAVYVANNYWSLTTRNDAEDGGEQFIIATALAGNLSTLALGKSASPLILSTQLATLASSNLVVGHTAASARLYVRGDGTNPIARFENSAGLGSFVVSNSINAVLSGVLNPTYQATSSNSSNHSISFGLGNSGNRAEFAMGSSLTNFAIINGGGFTGFSMVNGNGERNAIIIGNNGVNGTSGTSRVVIQDSIAEAAGALNFRPLNIAYTINNSGLQGGTATGIFLNATETALNGMTHNLIDLQVGGVSRFKIRNDGRIDCLNIVSTGNVFASYFGVTGGLVGLSATASGVLLVNDAASTSFSRMMLGGTTNLFPAIKRNGAALETRLADDSGLCNLFTGVLNADSFNLVVNGYASYFQYALAIGKSTGVVASAVLELSSTTRGFLPPRMDDVAVRAIGTPANGLVVYNTTLNSLCVYEASAWRKLNSSPM